ncbi:hypothetical protein TWF481_002963 [Arthrobotrys musiformis]|uniref:Uncharacterized protein n=1 Tax=Arthrobotrys musiformis TaxID=47236 RepID=A0AAV9VTH6_9PEZI
MSAGGAPAPGPGPTARTGLDRIPKAFRLSTVSRYVNRDITGLTKNQTACQLLAAAVKIRQIAHIPLAMSTAATKALEVYVDEELDIEAEFVLDALLPAGLPLAMVTGVYLRRKINEGYDIANPGYHKLPDEAPFYAKWIELDSTCKPMILFKLIKGFRKALPVIMDDPPKLEPTNVPKPLPTTATAAEKERWLYDITKAFEDFIHADIPKSMLDDRRNANGNPGAGVNPGESDNFTVKMEVPSWMDDIMESLSTTQLLATQSIVEQRKMNIELKSAAEKTAKNYDSKPLPEGILKEFEPDGTANDALKAMELLETIDYALTTYPSERVRNSLREVIKGDMGRNWLLGLTAVDLKTMAESTTHWKVVLERDWIKTQTNTIISAQAEVFSFSQGRSINEYITKKLRLLKTIPGATYDDNNIITQIHEGIHHDEYKAAADYARFQGLDQYRRALNRLEETQKPIWERSRNVSRRVREMNSNSNKYGGKYGAPIPTTAQGRLAVPTRAEGRGVATATTAEILAEIETEAATTAATAAVIVAEGGIMEMEEGATTEVVVMEREMEMELVRAVVTKMVADIGRSRAIEMRGGRN